VAKIVSVNIARPRELSWRGRRVRTGIYKEPVPGPVAVHRLGLAGDLQADLRFHGGIQKAVYLYPNEHYEFWREELPGVELLPGAFGENLTTQGLLENDTHIGDRLRVGPVIFEVTEPRSPCFKLALKFGRRDIVKRFLASGRSGFYLAVVQEGKIESGLLIERISHDPQNPSVKQAFVTNRTASA